MFTKSTTLLTISTLLTLATAHFDVTFPPDRGDNAQNQATGPCGGLDTPSAQRTQWPLTGGRLAFEAGHDEAHTEVHLGLGDNPTEFPIVLAPTFNQIGLGEFCWDTLAIPEGTEGIEDGVKGTIRVRQGGHGGDGWLYNCADIVFSSSAAAPTGECNNGTGVAAEPIAGGSGDGHTDNTTNPGSPKPDEGGAASGLKVLMGSAIVAASLAAGFLGF